MKLVLASTSPYRKALLEQLHLEFSTMDSQVDEDKFKQELSDPFELTKVLAHEKAKSVFDRHPDQQAICVIGGDQISLHNGVILGKPHTVENAINQLLTLQGSKHQLVTSTCLYTSSQAFQWTEVVNLSMRPLSRAQATKYVEIDQPLNCAGSYKIESLGINLFEEVQCADHSAIVGMPLIELGIKLRELGLDPLTRP